MPVIVLTASDAVDDQVAGLEGGADDYMTKPFALRRAARPCPSAGCATSGTAEPTVLRYGTLTLDLRTRLAHVDGAAVDLTAREFTMLEVLLRHPGQVLSREQLLDHVWGLGFDPGSNIVDVYVRYLRKKLGPGSIETVRGMDYRLAVSGAGRCARLTCARNQRPTSSVRRLPAPFAAKGPAIAPAAAKPSGASGTLPMNSSPVAAPSSAPISAPTTARGARCACASSGAVGRVDTLAASRAQR